MKLPIITYIKRYWILLAIIGVLIWGYSTSSISLTMRAALIIPIFTLIAGASGLLLRNTYNRLTTDRYVDDKAWIKRDWDSLTPFQRILITKAEALVYFIGGCLVAAGLTVVGNGF